MVDRAPAPLARQPALLDRIRGWFAGPRQSRPATARSAGARAAAARAAAPEREIAPLDRMTVAQWLWGDGFVMPGDADYVLDLVKPFGLTPAMSMLDLSAGLGGPARVIARAFGTYVTGLERAPDRAKRGMEMSVAANLAKRAAVVQYNPESVELRANGFDCILGRNATYNVVEKERLLRVLHHALKARGQLMLNEFTRNPDLGGRPELADWAATESYPPSLWTVGQYGDCLAGLGFDIRVVEDVSRLYRTMIVAGWGRMLREVDLKGMATNHRRIILDEAERWVRRIAALESGALRVYRIYALANKTVR